MIARQPYEYVSIIGMNFLQPIADLMELLGKSDPQGPNKVQASVTENGYSVSSIVLAVFVIESALNRTQYVLGRNPSENSIRFFRRIAPSDLADDLEELFTVRNAIAHSHGWEAWVRDDEKGGMKLVSAKLRPGYGKGAFKKVLDPSTRKTRRLGINLLPTRIHRSDAVCVLKKTVDILLFLENKDRRYFYLSPNHVRYQGSTLPLRIGSRDCSMDLV